MGALRNMTATAHGSSNGHRAQPHCLPPTATHCAPLTPSTRHHPQPATHRIAAVPTYSPPTVHPQHPCPPTTHCRQLRPRPPTATRRAHLQHRGRLLPEDAEHGSIYHRSPPPPPRPAHPPPHPPCTSSTVGSSLKMRSALEHSSSISLAFSRKRRSSGAFHVRGRSSSLITRLCTPWGPPRGARGVVVVVVVVGKVEAPGARGCGGGGGGGQEGAGSRGQAGVVVVIGKVEAAGVRRGRGNVRCCDGQGVCGCSWVGAWVGAIRNVGWAAVKRQDCCLPPPPRVLLAWCTPPRVHHPAPDERTPTVAWTSCFMADTCGETCEWPPASLSAHACWGVVHSAQLVLVLLDVRGARAPPPRFLPPALLPLCPPGGAAQTCPSPFFPAHNPKARSLPTTGEQRAARPAPRMPCSTMVQLAHRHGHAAREEGALLLWRARAPVLVDGHAAPLIVQLVD